MSAPKLEDLPKVAEDLKSQLEGFKPDNLKDTVTQEKNPLPTAEDVAIEKNQQKLIDGIESFDPAKLKHAETQEKNPSPDKDAIEQEKGQKNLINGIENFDSTKLKHTETCEKKSTSNQRNHRRREKGLRRIAFTFRAA